MDERQLVQTICAFRLLAPEVELSLSTRESPWFRDRVIPLAINNVSAFSKTQPGGYADNHPELEQFAPHDDRRPEEVAGRAGGQRSTAGMEGLGQLAGTRFPIVMITNVIS